MLPSGDQSWIGGVWKERGDEGAPSGYSPTSYEKKCDNINSYTRR
jgi:hypothetical protein